MKKSSFSGYERLIRRAGTKVPGCFQRCVAARAREPQFVLVARGRQEALDRHLRGKIRRGRRCDIVLAPGRRGIRADPHVHGARARHARPERGGVRLRIAEDCKRRRCLRGVKRRTRDTCKKCKAGADGTGAHDPRRIMGQGLCCIVCVTISQSASIAGPRVVDLRQTAPTTRFGAGFVKGRTASAR